MRVVHTCLRYPPATGGVETYVRELVEHTRDITAGFDVRVLTSKMKTHNPIQELKPEQLLDDPPYVQRLHHSRTPLIAYPRLQALSYYLGHHQPDILHGYSFWYQPADVAARFAQRQRVPFIFHPMYYSNQVRRKWRWRVYQRTIGYQTFAAADVVVVISPFERNLIRQAKLPVKRFALVPPGVEVKEFAVSSRNPFLSRRIRGTILLTVSRLSRGKGLPDVIKAMPQIIRQIQDAQLAIVGEDFGDKQNLQKLADKIGVRRRVHWLGKLNRPELIAAYKSAAVFVHPSYYEAFGIVLAEALAAKTPVVARDCSAIPYVVPPDRAGLLFNNQYELSKQVGEVLKNDNLRRRLTAKGYQRVKEKFTKEKARRKLLRIYSDLGAGKVVN